MTLQNLKDSLLQALTLLNSLRNMTPKQTQLLKVAKTFLGKDASPSDLAPDELGCAESVSDVLRAAFPELKFPTLLSTLTLYNYLRVSPSFAQVSAPQSGDIILSVTGTGTGTISNGHTGIIGLYGILSNDSRTGTWEENWTMDSWRRYYEDKGGFPTHFFTCV